MINNQYGRTILETLSIIAIIGVITVLGLQLYAKAMNTIRANYIIEQVFIKSNELVENPIANRMINGKKRGKMVDVSIQDTGKLSYGYSFCGSSDNCAPKLDKGEIIVTVKGFFPMGLCKTLKKKIRTQEYQGLKNIKANGTTDLKTNDCPTSFDISSMTFIVDSEFKEQTF